jgi:hypothetical protein
VKSRFRSQGDAQFVSKPGNPPRAGIMARRLILPAWIAEAYD